MILEEKKIDAFELRKKRELNKKFNKQVTVQKRDEKRQRFNDEVSEIKKHRIGGTGSSSEKLEQIIEKGNRFRTEKSNKRVAMVRELYTFDD